MWRRPASSTHVRVRPSRLTYFLAKIQGDGRHYLPPSTLSSEPPQDEQ